MPKNEQHNCPTDQLFYNAITKVQLYFLYSLETIKSITKSLKL